MTEADIQEIAMTLNLTPRKCLGFRSPVDGFFAKLTRWRLRHGVFHSLIDLQQAINTFVQTHNARPKPLA